MPKFSQQLISETITCFYEEDGVLLTQEEALAVLDSLSGLYLAFTPGQCGDGSGTRLSADGGVHPAGARNTGSTLPNET